MSNVNAKLEEMNVVLPPVPPLAGLYTPIRQMGNILYVSGQGPTVNGIPLLRGKLGTLSVEQGQFADRHCALNALSNLKSYLGNLDKLKGVVKTLGFVASDIGFGRQPEVVNGCSEFLKELFGTENGIGARSAIGVAQLPDDIPVEIEFIFELE